MAGAWDGAADALLAARNAPRTADAIARACASWSALEARGLRLSMDPTSGLGLATGRERPVLAGEVGGAAARVCIETDAVHNAHTEVRVSLDGRSRAAVLVLPSPGGVLARVRDWVEVPVEVGEPGFDAVLLVLGRPPSAARRLLGSARLRERLRALADGSLVALEHDPSGGRVVLHGVACVETIGLALDALEELVRAAR